MEAWVAILVAAGVCCLVSICASFVFAALASPKAPKGLQSTANANRQSMNSEVDLQPAVCPAYYGFYNCTDDRFNTGFQPGVAKTLDKQLGYDASEKGSIGAKHLCCKFMNALGDERPEVRSKVRAAQKRVGIFTLVLSIVTSLLPMGVIASVATEMAFTGADIAIAQVGEQPYTTCQNSWKGSSDDVIVHKFKNEQGQQAWQLFTTKDGCPIKVGLPKELEYAHQVGQAAYDLAKIDQTELSVDVNKVKMVSFDDFKPSYETSGRDLSRIQCTANCEKDPNTNWCKCAKCTNTDPETGECRRCERVKGDEGYTCSQRGAGDRSPDIPIPFDICNGAGRGC